MVGLAMQRVVVMSVIGGGAACDFDNEIDPYTEYYNLNGDWNAFTADDCKAGCCNDPSCTVWQFAQYPMGHQAQCMWGDSSDFGDSGGIQFEGEQGRGDPGGGGAQNFRCVNNTCVSVDGPGFPSNETCQDGCGPVPEPPCPAALQATCGEAKETGGRDACLICTGVHNSSLAEKGCDASDYSVFCDDSRLHLAQDCTFQNEIDPYTMYNDLNGDSTAQSSEQCKANCCADANCDVWQWSDDPRTPPNCWSGNSQDYGDSGGVEWQGEQGKGPAPAPGPAPSPSGFRCVNNTCVSVDGAGFPSNETCTHGCGPVPEPPCPAALQATCGEAKETGGRDACLICTGVHNNSLAEKGCDASDYSVFCDDSRLHLVHQNESGR
jgi:hypothetical protein